MRDGRTQRLVRKGEDPAGSSFLEDHRVVLVTLSGATAGQEYLLDRAPLTLGRGPGVDLAFDDPAMSRQHASFELHRDGFRVRDLGSTNGLRVNGSPASGADLEHGDRLEIGGHRFQYVVEAQKRAPQVHLLEDD